jgi:hypothetical protein
VKPSSLTCLHRLRVNVIRIGSKHLTSLRSLILLFSESYSPVLASHPPVCGTLQVWLMKGIQSLCTLTVNRPNWSRMKAEDNRQEILGKLTAYFHSQRHGQQSQLRIIAMVTSLPSFYSVAVAESTR